MVQNLSDNPLFKALDKQYDAEIAAAYASALIYFNNSTQNYDLRIYTGSYYVV